MTCAHARLLSALGRRRCCLWESLLWERVEEEQAEDGDEDERQEQPHVRRLVQRRVPSLSHLLVEAWVTWNRAKSMLHIHSYVLRRSLFVV